MGTKKGRVICSCLLESFGGAVSAWTWEVSVKAREREALPCRILAPDFEMKSSPGTVVALYVLALDCGNVEKSLWKRMEE